MKNSALKKLNSIDPRDCINSKLRRISRMATHIYETELKEFGLRSSQVSILLMVGKKAQINQKDVADFLFLDQSTMSRDLNKLTEQKLIQTSKGSDARHSLLELTEKGYELLDTLIPAWKKIHDKIEKTIGTINVANIDLITEGLKQHTKR